ncbi:MAG: chromate efflux transporter [Anaerolineae bacterium]|nr:chromate efflux transporter [Anaerolineae bacterium]
MEVNSTFFSAEEELITDASTPATIPHEPYPTLFWRYLRFGFLAWGGPVAQIAMIRQELVDEEKWITSERFNRVLAVYQVLPGPEAHELCVYFGMLSRGRIGGLLAGLGFMLPGFLLMFALSWLYVTYGTSSPLFAAVFQGMQPAVAALIVRAIHRIGGHALRNDHWLWGIALVSGLAQLLDIHFAITLIVAGAVYTLVKRDYRWLAAGLSVAFLTWITFVTSSPAANPIVSSAAVNLAQTGSPSLESLFLSGLRGGLLTFGGAYTVIPFLQHDAVEVSRWMTNAQFLDGLALSGLLPAPLIIFSTFVGYIGGGPWGALLLTLGIFAPAFAFTLIGHDYVEHLVENQAAHAFLDGVTAGVVGLIGATALNILHETVAGLPAWVIFTLALLVLFRWKAKGAVAVVVLGAGAAGLLLFYA